MEESKCNLKKAEFIIFLIGIFFLVIMEAGVVLSSFEAGDESHFINKESPPNSFVSGWINLSFANEPSDSLFKGNFGGSIALIDLLDSNDAEYNCSPSDCSQTYTAENKQTSKTFSLNPEDKEKLISIKIKDKINQIIPDTFKLKIDITNKESCSSPLKIDFFADDKIDWAAGEMTDDFSCSVNKGYGCFNSEESSNNLRETDIVTKPYCNKINLPERKRFKIGAWIKKGSNPGEFKEGLLKMSLYDKEGYFLSGCNLPEPSAGGGEISCIASLDEPNYETQEFYVCLNSDENTDYKTRYEKEKPCGFFDYPLAEDFTADYQIFARGAKFKNTGSFVLNNSVYEDVEYDLDDYLNDNYHKDCTNEGCNIPIKFITNLTDNEKTEITLSDFNVKYETEFGIVREKNLYDSKKQSARISADYQQLNLNVNNGIFKTPDSYGHKTFLLTYNNQQLFSERIKIEKIPLIKNLNPKVVAAYQKTKFVLSAENVENKEVEYSWDFGDDSDVEETEKNYAEHVYTDIGNYTIGVGVKEKNSSKEYLAAFNIQVKSPRDIINITLDKYKKRMNKIRAKVDVMPSWYGRIIKEKLRLNESEMAIEGAEEDYSDALAEEDDELFLEIMSNLVEIYIPEDIGASEKASNLPVILDSGEINLGALEEVSGEDFFSIDGAEEKIASWIQNNLNIKLSYEVVSGYEEGFAEPIVAVYKLIIDAQEDSSTRNYVVLASDSGRITLNGNYGSNLIDEGGMIAIKFNELKDRAIEFAVEDLEDAEDVFIFLAPEKSVLEGGGVGRVGPCNFNLICEEEEGENWKNCRNDCKPTSITILLVAVVLVIAGIVFLIMKRWYKYKYESHLFKNKNDLINLMNFVNNALKNKMRFSQIKNKLKQAGWNSEQIAYAYKKFHKRIKKAERLYGKSKDKAYKY